MNNCARWVVSLLIAVVALPAAAEEARLDAAALFERSVTRDVRLTANGAGVELDRGALYEDDGPAAGYSYEPNEEKLSRNVWIKKELLVPDPRAAGATLLVGPGGALKAVVNGKPLELRRQGKVGNHWDAYPLPPESLRAGRNEIVLHGEGRVWVARDADFAAGSRTRTRHPDRSARSADGGKTWDYGRLGPRGDLDGEYYVRVFLDQHKSAGELVLPVFDAGNLEGRTVGDPIASVGPVRVRVDSETGEGGRLSVRVRSGATCAPGPGWTDWRDLAADGGVLKDPAGRFVQVAVTLATADPLHTPRLKGVTVEASPEPAGDWSRGVRVVDSRNERVVRTSIPFEYEPFDHPRLKRLREQHDLDHVVRGAESEFGLVLKLAAWSSGLWSKGHLAESYPPWDAIEILEPHPDGTLTGGFCQQYNVVFLQACESFGIPGRAVSLGPGALLDKPRRGGHEVVEVWSNEHRKWVYVDGQFAWYAADRESGVPLSLWELRRRQLAVLAGEPSKGVRVVNIVAPGRERWEGLDKGIPFGELRLIPRSNFLQERTPLPLNQGMRGWFWTGHYVWTDEKLPAAPLYGNRVTSRSNWDWTLNGAHCVLEATDAPGELRVHLDTETPGFDTFLADVDGAGERPVSSGFLWKLHDGENRLEVRPRNVAGRPGITSRIVLDYR